MDIEERVNILENRMTKVETKVDDIKEDLKEIKAFQSKLMFGIIGTMGTSLLSLIMLVFSMLRKG